MAPKLVHHDKEKVKDFIGGLTAISFNPAVRCSECNHRFKTAKGLYDHYIKVGIPAPDLAPLKVLRNERDRTNYAAEPVQYRPESSYISPDKHGICTRVWCNTCMCTVPKLQVKPHFTTSVAHRADPLSLDELAQWDSITDGWGIQHRKKVPKTDAEVSTFEAACKQAFPDPPALVQCDVAVPCHMCPQQPALIHVMPSVSTPAAELQANTDMLPAPLQHAPSTTHRQPTPPVGPYSIRTRAKTFKLPSPEQLASNKARRRFRWPVAVNCGVDLSIFETDCMTQETSHHVLYAKMFFSLFYFGTEVVSLKDVYKKLYEDGTMREAFTLELLSPRLNWSRKIRHAMSRLAKSLSLAYEDDGDIIGAMRAANFDERFRANVKKANKRATIDSLLRRKEIDRHRLTLVAPVAYRNYAAAKAARDIEIIHRENLQAFNDTGCLPKFVGRVLNSLTTGYMQFRTVVNRAGELNRFPADRMQACVDDPSQWYVIVDGHKTIRTSGPLGRHVSDEAKPVLRRHLALQCRKRNLLFTPIRNQKACTTCKYTQMHRHSMYYALACTPEYPYTEPTLERKLQRSEIMKKENRVKATAMAQRVDYEEDAKRPAALCAEVMGHLGETGTKHYDLNVGSPERQATTIRAYVEIFLGELPELTEADEFIYATRTTADIVRQFREAELTDNRRRKAQKLSAHEGTAPSQAASAGSTWAACIEAFLKLEMQVGQCSDCNIQGIIYMTTPEKWYVLTVLREHVMSYGDSANPVAQWGIDTKMKGIVANAVRQSVQAESITLLAMQFLQSYREALAEFEIAELPAESSI